MDKIQSYLEILPLPALAAAVVVACFAIMMVPPRWRLPLGFFLLPIWSTLAWASELGMPATIAKATMGLLFLYIAFAALFDPWPKRRIPAVLWAYPFLGAVSLVYASSADDRAYALVVQLQWIFLTFAAVLSARTVTDAASMRRIMKPMIIGIAVGLLIPLSNLLIEGQNVLATKGLRRFFPWGGNPNQMGVLFTLAIPFGLYMAMHTQNMLLRSAYGAMVAAGIAMALLTASRSVVILSVVVSIPLVLSLVRRPLLAAVLLLIGSSIIMLLFRDITGINYGRMTNLTSERGAILADYIAQSLERPLTGILGTSGLRFMIDPEIDSHAHNAYAWVLYQGGIPFFLGYIFLMVYTLSCTFRVWRKRASLPQDPLFTNLLVFTMLAVYAHGFVNMAIYFSTYYWASWHVLLSALMIIWASDLKGVPKGAVAAQARAAADTARTAVRPSPAGAGALANGTAQAASPDPTPPTPFEPRETVSAEADASDTDAPDAVEQDEENSADNEPHRKGVLLPWEEPRDPAPRRDNGRTPPWM